MKKVTVGIYAGENLNLALPSHRWLYLLIKILGKHFEVSIEASGRIQEFLDKNEIPTKGAKIIEKSRFFNYSLTQVVVELGGEISPQPFMVFEEYFEMLHGHISQHKCISDRMLDDLWKMESIKTQQADLAAKERDLAGAMAVY